MQQENSDPPNILFTDAQDQNDKSDLDENVHRKRFDTSHKQGLPPDEGQNLIGSPDNPSPPLK